ncbi:MAG: hypothetical protein GIX03_07420 [Candidatus Eremiobacteraeota bacterium]|nr:hypothetical protein [Candidatus Eremiobacteraeota bacterium]MBC5802820.1 hypothetical protein [Candidatus Eremiobacteraeota bacterium]MBC5821122.1 hypothetical protein [Candidatus Eremiobacteraeota bacterium]
MALSAFGLVLLSLLSPPAHGGGAPLNGIPGAPALRAPGPAPSVPRSDAQIVLEALNRERLVSGRPPLQFDERLSTLARAHALDMATRNYFSHNTPEGLSPFDRMDRAAYAYSYAGENMALDENPVSADRDLWNSPEHRNNILEPHYAKIGVAAVKTNGGELFVEDFSD